jgi:hypothetical protein
MAQILHRAFCLPLNKKNRLYFIIYRAIAQIETQASQY